MVNKNTCCYKEYKKSMNTKKFSRKPHYSKELLSYFGIWSQESQSENHYNYWNSGS